MMRLIIRTIIALAIVWIGLLLTGYGVLVGSTENAAGLGIQCSAAKFLAPKRIKLCTAANERKTGIAHGAN